MVLISENVLHYPTLYFRNQLHSTASPALPCIAKCHWRKLKIKGRLFVKGKNASPYILNGGR